MSKLAFPLFVACAALLAGCGKSEPSSAPATSAASSVAADGVRVLELTGNDQMKFNVTQLEAAAGETVRLVLRNVGSLPKAAMGHNVVVLKKGVDPMEFSIAAAAAAATEYFPTARSGDTIAHTRLIGPKEKAEVTFTVPTEPGEYPYICTFPGHTAAGMRGVLIVK
ncbi:plastocyanin/azurin family copper-binding protein [Opitutales bacterium ASA1]|uniref:plastocyanin/azurin family copper-binding protein n=1 Tax=Congregicoccus parvus TaxID=3081749 RepID=UPI002B2885E3|nr:plastocyanin/azurin family copper-binding protein [Opitutales bacterium ASA1]